MTRGALEALAHRWMRFWQGGSLEDFESVHAEGFTDRSAGARSSGRDGFKQGVVALYRAFPDFWATTQLVVADEAQSLVALRWSATGHHHGRFFDIAATGRQIAFKGIEIIRARDGLIVERWGEWDEGAILDQLRAAD